ncbi:MAG: N-acyl homoserine lactonase family protein [Gemmatimonadetes bacterium]|nr:N-acyl homoserine lactonase family protein [Gemmatimonadota bacterium]
MRFIRLGLLAAIGSGLVTSALPAQLGYQVYAVQYAQLPAFPVSALVLGADTTRTKDVSMMVWVLRSPTRTILVDAGFYRDEFLKSWKVEKFVRPSAAIAKLDIKPEQVTDVIITHLHWDHADGADLFPNANVWVQRAEYEHYQAPERQQRTGVFPVTMAMLEKFKRAGRLKLVEGDSQAVAPGVRVYTGGRHTHESQYVSVATGGSEAIIASDNLYLYENLERRRPIAATWDTVSNLRAQERMLRLAGPRRLIVPGHDPAVFEKFTLIEPGIAIIR